MSRFHQINALRKLYSAVRQLSCPLIALVACSTTLLQGKCKTDFTGEWEITAAMASWSGRAKITVTYDSHGNEQRSGEFRYLSGRTVKIVGGSCSPHFLTQTSEAPTPIYAYIGDFVSADGNSITYGTISALVPRGAAFSSWTGKRIVVGNGPPKVEAIVNAASGMQGQISPGELISIFSNPALNVIGPKEGRAAEIQGGMVSNSMGGVTVEFLPIGVLAPLTYVSPGQINAIVPYEVAGLSQVQVRVNFNGRSSEPFPISVAQAVPGIFTANGSGTGAGAILNHDGSVNSTARRERRGGVIVLYLTGAGQTTPQGVSGKITVPTGSEPYTPRPLMPATVHIDGQPARILFYGEAPGLVSGVVQMNVEIPVAISAGVVPISVTIEGKATRAGITVFIE